MRLTGDLLRPVLPRRTPVRGPRHLPHVVGPLHPPDPQPGPEWPACLHILDHLCHGYGYPEALPLLTGEVGVVAGECGFGLERGAHRRADGSSIPASSAARN